MRSLILAGSLVAVLAAPALANAQTACERDRSTNAVAGTAVGAGIGALLGSAIAGRGSHTAGAIVGGVAGGVAGNQIAKNSGEPCPPGYYETPTTAPAPPPAALPAVGPSNDFWRGAPTSIRERIGFLEERIRNGQADGTLSRRETDQAYRDLGEVRRMEQNLRDRDGGRLTVADRDYIQTRLDIVGRNVRWMRRNDASNAYNNSPDNGYRAAGWYNSQGVWHNR